VAGGWPSLLTGRHQWRGSSDGNRLWSVASRSCKFESASKKITKKNVCNSGLKVPWNFFLCSHLTGGTCTWWFTTWLENTLRCSKHRFQFLYAFYDAQKHRFQEHASFNLLITENKGSTPATFHSINKCFHKFSHTKYQEKSIHKSLTENKELLPKSIVSEFSGQVLYIQYTFVKLASRRCLNLLPLSPLIASWADYSISNCTKPDPFNCPKEPVATLHERLVQKGEHISCKLLLSMLGSRFFTNTLGRPFFWMLGSQFQNMIRIAFQFAGLKFKASNTGVAERQ
jgi:hypothetical protein